MVCLLTFHSRTFFIVSLPSLLSCVQTTLNNLGGFKTTRPVILSHDLTLESSRKTVKITDTQALPALIGLK